MLDGVRCELKKQIASDITCVTSPSQQQNHNFHELRESIRTRTVDNPDNTIVNNTKMVVINVTATFSPSVKTANFSSVEKVV
jgi:hypothetical protein